MCLQNMQTPHESLARLRNELPRRIRGQAEALTRLQSALARREYNAIPQHGPRGCFFFAGPTGVGKTETAKAMAEILCPKNELLRIDCSEYKTFDSFEGLLGNRSGDRGRLGRAYDRSPGGVWLWDEIEKAHPELVHWFLQMADAGRLTLACGDTLDLQGIYLVITSNLGSAEIIGREHLSFTSLERHVVGCIKRFLRPELLARFGKPFVFRPLNRKVQAEITEQHLEALLDWHRQQGRQIEFQPDVLSFLIHRGFSRDFGARALRNFIEEMVGDAVVDDLDAGGNGSGRLTTSGDHLNLVA